MGKISKEFNLVGFDNLQPNYHVELSLTNCYHILSQIEFFKSNYEMSAKHFPLWYGENTTVNDESTVID